MRSPDADPILSEESLTRVSIYPGRHGQHGTDRQPTCDSLRPVQIFVEPLEGFPIWQRPCETVERKGLGHSDTICDALAEEVCVALCRFYQEHFGVILHHNVDKLLLAGGASQPRFGGGTITQPIGLFFAGRATLRHEGIDVPVEELIQSCYAAWIQRNIPHLDHKTHVEPHYLLRSGSSELTHTSYQSKGLNARAANDTSCGVGYAPLSELAKAVLAIERQLNSSDFRQNHPAIGADIKVMGARTAYGISFSLACVMVDKYLPDLDAYRLVTQQVLGATSEIVQTISPTVTEIVVNPADDLASGDVYLTVSGTSAEAGDDGETGRGNRANGLISPYRPMTMEAVAGKNPMTHVGKLYNVIGHRIAASLFEEIPEVSEAECFILSRIGSPIDRPQVIYIRVRLVRLSALRQVKPRIEDIVEQHLARISELWRQFMNRALDLY